MFRPLPGISSLSYFLPFWSSHLHNFIISALQYSAELVQIYILSKSLRFFFGWQNISHPHLQMKTTWWSCITRSLNFLPFALRHSPFLCAFRTSLKTDLVKQQAILTSNSLRKIVFDFFSFLVFLSFFFSFSFDFCQSPTLAAFKTSRYNLPFQLV